MKVLQSRQYCLELLEELGMKSKKVNSVCIEFPSPSIFNKWIKSLRKYTITIFDYENDKEIPRIGRIKVSKWNTQDVQQWLEHNHFTFDTFNEKNSFNIYKNNFSLINGNDLMKMEIDQLETLGIENEEHRKSIKKSIIELKNNNNGCFNYKLFTLKSKSYKINFQKEYSRELFDLSGLLEKHFVPKKMDIFRKQAFVCSCHGNTIMPEYDEKDLDNTIFGVAVKVFLVEKEITIQKEKSVEFGKFVLVVNVGPWLLKYDDNSVIIPKLIFETDLNIYQPDFTVGVIKDMKLKRICEKLSRVIEFWNVKMNYLKSCPGAMEKTKHNEYVKNRKNEGNCYDFVISILSEFGLDLDDEKLFCNSIIRKLRENGEVNAIFNPQVEFCEYFGLKHTSYSFKTHKEFDKFLMEIIKKDEIGLMMDFRTEKNFLITIDVAFWRRLLYNRKMNGDCESLEIGDSKACIFGDPRKRIVRYSQFEDKVKDF